MILKADFEINRYDFTPQLFDTLHENNYVRDLWPLVYILSDGKVKEAYVGETTDALARMNTHLRSSEKRELTTVHLITGEKFNKSATLDIESNLIKYISGDGQYKLLNGNLGLANHTYYQKQEVYWNTFLSIWERLRSEGLAQHSVDHIDNSDLFKYSPYKSLSLVQRSGLLAIMKSLLDERFRNVVVEGGAGTGKTVLAVFLFKLINSDNEDFNFKEFGESEDEFVEVVKELKLKFRNPKMALVVPMASFRSTLKKVFRNVKGLRSSMVIGPSEVATTKYDILVVDESHRLRRRINLGTYFGSFDKACEKLGLEKTTCSELDWVILQSRKSILFYDHAQSIKPSDVRKEEFDELKSRPVTNIEKLKSQFRVKGGDSYVTFVDKLLNCSIDMSQKFAPKNYPLLLFNSIEDMVEEIKKKDSIHGLSRLIAGFSWPWISQNDRALFDIKIDEYQLRWNGTTEDWINTPSAVNEVGCIHTTQGYDLNYAGIIFGNEISYDRDKNEIVILKENYFDRNGKQSISDPEVLKGFIINIYKTILLRAIKGTYIYACDENLREYLSRYITVADSDKRTTATGYLSAEKVVPFENAIPVYDLQVAAGNFGDIQRVEDAEWIPVPLGYKPSLDLFACRVVGESMNRVIPNGSLCLFRKYVGGSRNGKLVLVESTELQDPDTGSRYTIKEYQSRKTYGEEGWQHESIILKPLSIDPRYKEIVLDGDDSFALKVIGIFEKVIS